MITLNRKVNPVRNECRRIAEEVNIFVNLLHYFERQLRDERPVGDQKDRHLFVAAAHSA